MAYYTSSGRLCPYPGMTDDDFDDFEHWEEKEFGVKPMNPNPPVGHERKYVCSDKS